MTNASLEHPPGTFSMRTLLLAVVTTCIACGMLTWASIRPLVLPLSIAIPLYWLGAGCMSLGERTGYRSILLLGCLAMSAAVVVGFAGTLCVAALWAIAALAQ